MSQNLPQTKTFDKDPIALNLVELMADPEYGDQPEAYIADEVGVSMTELRQYTKDPAFLDWMSKRLPKLYLSRLPQLMGKLLDQSINGGKGRQQKMLLEMMGLMEKKAENRAPNITIINNVPDYEDKKKPVVEIQDGD
jgi:hypothetical protein